MAELEDGDISICNIHIVVTHTSTYSYSVLYC